MFCIEQQINLWNNSVLSSPIRVLMQQNEEPRSSSLKKIIINRQRCESPKKWSTVVPPFCLGDRMRRKQKKKRKRMNSNAKIKTKIKQNESTPSPIHRSEASDKNVFFLLCGTFFFKLDEKIINEERKGGPRLFYF